MSERWGEGLLRSGQNWLVFRWLRRITAVGLVVLGVFALGGCGGQELTADTSCADFMAADQNERYEAVTQLSSELDAPSAATPLGRPNVDFICAGNPDTTLGEAVQASS